MATKTNEQALESAIQKHLTGTSIEELRAEGITIEERQDMYRAGNGYYIGSNIDYNAKYAIDEARFWHFLEATQPEELEKLQRTSDWKLKICLLYTSEAETVSIVS